MARFVDHRERALGFAALRWKFPQQEDRLFQLWETDPEFGKMCGDYGIALMAGTSPSGEQKILRQFHLIAAEIELQVEEILKK